MDGHRRRRANAKSIRDAEDEPPAPVARAPASRAPGRGAVNGAASGTSPLEKLYFEDYAVGESFESVGRTFTEADLVLYSMFTGDWDRLLTSDGRWKVPEMFAYSVGLCLLLGIGRFVYMPRSFIAFYGFDHITFGTEIGIGDTIRSTVTVTDLVERDEGRGIIVWRHETVDQHGRQVCSSNHRALCGRRGEQ